MSKHIEKTADKRSIPADDFVIAYLALDEKSRALDWLDNAYEERNDLIYSIQADPRLDALRNEPRFQEVLDKVREA